MAGHYPHQLSGGQRQRLREELGELLSTLRMPMLLITHDDEDVRCLGDEVVHLRAGRVVPTLAPTMVP